MEWMDVVVSDIRNEAPGVLAFELRAATGEVLPQFDAGAHLDVHLAHGLIRQYSLCNGPDCRDHYLIGVKEEPESRGGSRWMHRGLRKGEVIQVSTPKNNFPLAPGARHYIFVAGGIGITPILSMARHLAVSGASFELHYFARSEHHFPFRELIAATVPEGQLRLHAGLSPEETERVLADVVREAKAESRLYMCGPGPLMEKLVALAAGGGWRPDHIHLERFSAPTPCTEGGEFSVRLVRSGKTFAIPPDRTITQVLAEQGIAIPTSCEAGVCGTCLTDILSGDPDHRDVYLSDADKAAGRKLCPCVSRSFSATLELDL